MILIRGNRFILVTLVNFYSITKSKENNSKRRSLQFGNILTKIAVNTLTSSMKNMKELYYPIAQLNFFNYGMFM